MMKNLQRDSFVLTPNSDKKKKVFKAELPDLNLSQEQEGKLDNLTKFTHQFLKFGEKRNIIPTDSKRLNHTIQLATTLHDNESARESHRIKQVGKKESFMMDSIKMASKNEQTMSSDQRSTALAAGKFRPVDRS